MSSVRPDVSVIVATRNRPAELTRCLAALASSTLAPERLEVVVVDDGGSAPLGPVVDGMRGGCEIRLLHIGHGGAGRARNHGVREARAPVVAFTDDDCLPRPEWAETLHAAVVRDPRRLVGGRTLNGLSRNPYAATSQRVVDAVYAWANSVPDEARFVASNNMAADRDALLETGGFDERFTVASEDRELCDRWRWEGRRIAYAPAAVVEHRHELGLRGFAAQHVRYGRGAYLYHRTRRARGSGSIVDELGFALDPRRWPWPDGRATTVGERLRDMALIGLWQAANTWGFVQGAARDARELDRSG